MRQKNRKQQILHTQSKESQARSSDKIHNNKIRSTKNIHPTPEARHDKRTGKQKNMVFKIPITKKQAQQTSFAQTNRATITKSKIFRGFEK